MLEIYVEGNVEEKTPIKEALEIMTDDWIENGNCCDMTIVGLRDALKSLLKEPKKENIVSMSLLKNDGTLRTPEQCLKECLENNIGKVGAFKNGKKLIIIALDDTDDNFDVGWMQAGLKTSEMLSLVEVTKQTILNGMGYNEY